MHFRIGGVGWQVLSTVMLRMVDQYPGAIALSDPVSKWYPAYPNADRATVRMLAATSRKVKPLTADEDVFGDGSVVVFRTPGHTPGHTALLVRQKEKGPVILIGDAAHFHENYDSNGVPGFNFDRAQTIASLERIKAIEKNLKATVIIQHDPRDIDKLPAFPGAAR